MSYRSKSISPTQAFIMSFGLTYIPHHILGIGSIYLRNFFVWALMKGNTTSLPIYTEDSHSEKYHIIKLKPEFKLFDDETHAGQTDSDEVIIYIHGGGFVMCDCTDFQVASGLLPCLYEKLGSYPPSVYSLHYPLIKSDRSGSRYHQTQLDVFAAYNEITKSGKKVVAMMGDSAGGNLVLGLAYRLIANGADPATLPCLVLISPWLNIFTCDEQNDVGNVDYLHSNALRHAHDTYLGLELSRKLYQSHHAYLNEPFGRHQTADGWRQYMIRTGNNLSSLIQNPIDGTKGFDLEYVCPSLSSDEAINMLPPILLLTGEDELFYGDISLFNERLSKVNDNLVALGKSPKHQYINGKEEIHVYSCFWTNILRTLMACIKLDWIFDMACYFRSINRVRNDYRIRALQNVNKKNNEEWKVSASLPIHSVEAFEAIKKFTVFIADYVSSRV